MQTTHYIIDFDSTLVTIETLDELARIALADDPDAAQKVAQLEHITHLGMSGELGFSESLARRMEILSAHQRHIDSLSALLARHLSPSALRSAEWFEREQSHIYIISGGFEQYIKPAARLLGLDDTHVYANSFTFDPQGNITGYDTSRYTAQTGGKAKQVRALELDGHVVVIGDGYTDYEIVKSGEADEFWAYTETIARPNVTAVADRIVQSFDEVVKANKELTV
jgi:D-3-phosphoglycerate dehydrogenase